MTFVLIIPPAQSWVAKEPGSGFASDTPEAEPVRDTWPAPPPEWFKPCGCVFPNVDPPPGQHWDHAPDCPDAGH